MNLFKLNRFVTVDKNLSNPINCKWSSIKPSFPNAVSSDTASATTSTSTSFCLYIYFDFQSTSSLYSSPHSRHFFCPVYISQLLTFPCNLFAVTVQSHRNKFAEISIAYFMLYIYNIYFFIPLTFRVDLSNLGRYAAKEPYQRIQNNEQRKKRKTFSTIIILRLHT